MNLPKWTGKAKKMVEFFEAPVILAFIGAVLAAIGTIWASARQNEEKATLARERLTFERDLRKKSDENAELNKKLAATVTGGDSYCYLHLSNADYRSNESEIRLMHEGIYPLYDVNVTVNDIDQMLNIVKERLRTGATKRESSRKAQAALAKTSSTFEIGNMAPNQVRELGWIKFPKSDKFSLNVDISARNGFVEQAFRFRRVDGKWTRAEQIKRNGAVIKEEIHPEMPREADGSFRW